MSFGIRGLTKRYGATLALDGVDLDIRPGEVHALLGHNGAGKSPVIGCLGGRTAPTQGTIQVGSDVFTSLDPRGSIAAGIAVIYQHLSLIDSLTVTENLFLGQELTQGRLVIRRTEQRARAAKALERVGAQIDPDAIVGELTMGQRQMVEIAKALQRNARLLILDEPSAALSPVESRRLAELVLALREDGIAILYVTHLLNEVMRVADRATVLSGGRVVWESPESGFTKPELVSAISGGAHDAWIAPAPVDRSDPPLFELDGFAPGSGPEIDLQVHAGEIVALYGLIGSGRTRLLESVFGRRPHRGTIRVAGSPVVCTTPDRALRAGIAFVPSDRKKQGLFGILPAGENLVTRAMHTLGSAWLRNRASERELIGSTFASMSVRPPEPLLPIDRYSGGNQQKVLIGRWVNSASHVRVLLLDDPTQGVDVGARAEIYEVIRTLAAQQRVAVIYATNEPEEVMALAHRCVVLEDGTVTDDLSIDEATGITDEFLLELIHSDTTHGGPVADRKVLT